MESWPAAVECGVDGKWSISQLPLKCVATCQEDVIIKGRKMIGSESSPELEDQITKPMALAKHCKPLQNNPEMQFKEGKTCVSVETIFSYLNTPQT